MTSSSRVIVAMLVVALAGAAFWVLALSPKREEASELGTEVSQLQSSLVLAQNQVSEGLAAKHEFPSDYRQLVVLGQAVPAGDDTSSLLVELNRIANRSEVSFQSIQLGTEGASPESSATGSAPTAPEAGPTTAVPASATTPPTEAAAALLPLGATIGPAGLAVMPYTLTFQGDFFHVADFIEGLDSLVQATNAKVSVDGRLVTLDGFALTENADSGFPNLDASFTVTTYIVSPSQGITAGATPAAPAPVEATPASTTTPSAR